MSQNKKKAYTLIEIIVALAIISILALLVIPNIFNLVVKANKKICIENQRLIELYVDLFEIEKQRDISLDELNQFLIEYNIECPDHGIYSIVDANIYCSKHNKYIESPVDYLFHVWIISAT